MRAALGMPFGRKMATDAGSFLKQDVLSLVVGWFEGFRRCGVRAICTCTQPGAPPGPRYLRRTVWERTIACFSRREELEKALFLFSTNPSADFSKASDMSFQDGRGRRKGHRFHVTMSLSGLLITLQDTLNLLENATIKKSSASDRRASIIEAHATACSLRRNELRKPLPAQVKFETENMLLNFLDWLIEELPKEMEETGNNPFRIVSSPRWLERATAAKVKKKQLTPNQVHVYCNAINAMLQDVTNILAK